QPALRFLCVRPRIDGLASKIDAAADQTCFAAEPLDQILLRYEGICAGDEDALGETVGQHLHRLFDPACSARDDDRRIRPLVSIGRSPERHSEKNETESVEKDEEGQETRDHGALRNALSTAARATSVASNA